MDFLFDELISVSEELGSNDDNTGSSITNLFILKLGQLTQNLGKGYEVGSQVSTHIVL